METILWTQRNNNFGDNFIESFRDENELFPLFVGFFLFPFFHFGECHDCTCEKARVQHPTVNIQSFKMHPNQITNDVEIIQTKTGTRITYTCNNNKKTVSG